MMIMKVHMAAVQLPNRCHRCKTCASMQRANALPARVRPASAFASNPLRRLPEGAFPTTAPLTCPRSLG